MPQHSTADSAAKTGDVSLTNASPEEVAKQAQAAGPAHFQPGLWETKAEIANVDMPNLPAAQKEQMMAAMKKASGTAVKTCLTPEQANKPQAEMFTGKDSGNCTFDHYDMSSGKIDAKLNCKNPQGGKMTQTISGTFTNTGFALESEVHSEGGPGAMTMKVKTTGTRIGECKS